MANLNRSGTDVHAAAAHQDQGEQQATDANGAANANVAGTSRSEAANHQGSSGTDEDGAVVTAAGSAVTAAGWPARSLTAAFVPQPIVTTGNADVNISRVVVGWLMQMRQWVLVKVVFQVINGTQRKVIMVNPIVQEFVRKSFVQKGGTIWSKTKMRKRASKLLEWGLKNWTGGDFVVLILIGSTFFSQVCATSDRHSALSQCENADEAIQVIIDELLGRDSEIRRHAPAPDVEMPDVQDEMQEDAAQSRQARMATRMAMAPS